MKARNKCEAVSTRVPSTQIYSPLVNNSFSLSDESGAVWSVTHPTSFNERTSEATFLFTSAENPDRILMIHNVCLIKEVSKPGVGNN